MVAPGGRAWLLGGVCMVAPGGGACVVAPGGACVPGGHVWRKGGVCGKGGHAWRRGVHGEGEHAW